jgi:hypothetical protein
MYLLMISTALLAGVNRYAAPACPSSASSTIRRNAQFENQRASATAPDPQSAGGAHGLENATPEAFAAGRNVGAGCARRTT